jgi:hypothetical protein
MSVGSQLIGDSSYQKSMTMRARNSTEVSAPLNAKISCVYYRDFFLGKMKGGICA